MSTFISILKRWFGKKNGRSRDPGQDWHLLLTVGMALLIASVVWNVWFFNRVVTEEMSQTYDASNALGSYDAETVKEIFEIRGMSAEAYRNTYLFVDPAR